MRMMSRTTTIVAAAVLLAMCCASPARAQSAAGPTVRVLRHTTVLENPRGDSFVLGTVDAGEVLEVLDRQGTWYHVIAPARMARPRGWIQAASVQLIGTLPTPPGQVAAAAVKRPRGRLMVRGFGQAGASLFTAKNSFETIFGTAAGTMFGAGGQVVFPNGGFVQASGERFTKTGSRVFVSGTQVFTLDVPDTITVTPIHVTVGYRDHTYRAAAPYFGVGLGWQMFREESSSAADAQQVDHGHISYHVMGGIEIPVSAWLSVAGEIQWTGVPNGLGDAGIGTVVHEDDLGGVAFRFKLIIGH